MNDALIFPTVIVFILAYLICGIPFGLLIARGFGTDVRKRGSGNIGATNVGRTVGKSAAVLTLLCDVGKGFICTVLARPLISLLAGINMDTLTLSEPLGICITLIYLACILGHVYSPYLGLHGGKGISVGFGAALGMHASVALGLLVVFLLAAIPTKYVSLGSICAAISLPIICFFLKFSIPALIPMIITALIVLRAHSVNIRALINGKERKFHFHSSKEAQ